MSKPTRTKFKFSKQGNLILCLLIVYYFFYGYICFIYNEEISYQLIFLHRILFNKQTWAALPIIFIALIVMGVREHFFENAMRNTFYISLFTILMGFIWYWFNLDLKLFSITFWREVFHLNTTFFGITKVEGYYRFEGYISIITIFVINYISTFIGCLIRMEYEKYLAKLQRIKLYEGKEVDPWSDFSDEEEVILEQEEK